MNQNTSPIVRWIAVLSFFMLDLSFIRAIKDNPAAIDELIISIQLEYNILLSESARMIARFAIAITDNRATKKYKGRNDSLFLWIFKRPIKLLNEFSDHHMEIIQANKPQYSYVILYLIVV